MRRILLLAGIWGWSFVFIKVIVRGVTPPTMACLRCALGAVALLVVCRVRGLRLPRPGPLWGHFVVMGTLYSAVPFTMLGFAEQRTTSALAAVCQADTPLCTALFAALVVRERLRRAQVVGLVVGFAGVAVAAGLSAGDLARSSSVGALTAAGAGACYGLGFTYARRHLGAVAPEVAATGQVIAGAAVSAPVALVTSLGSGFRLPLVGVGALLLLGVVGTGIAYAVNYASIAELGPTRASLVTYLVPVVAVVVGVVVLAEPVQARLATGGAITVVGIALVQNRVRFLRRALTRVPVVGAVVASLLLGACGRSGATPAGCGRAVRDPLDPRSVVHVLAGSPDPTYLTDPPTSGEHQSVVVRTYRGVVAVPLRPQVQVGLLESGQVVVQYRAADPGARDALGPLAADYLVTVAPNPALPAPVTATAWTWRLTCASASPAAVASLRRFVAAHEGRGPQPAPPPT